MKTNHLKYYDQKRRLSMEEIRDPDYVSGPRLSLHPSLTKLRRIMSEGHPIIVLQDGLAYELMKLDLYEQQEHGCGLESGRCHLYVGGVCPNCPSSVTIDQPSFKCKSEQERLARLESRAASIQQYVPDDAYLIEHVPPEAHGLLHGYRTNYNIIRSLIEFIAEEGLLKDFLRLKHGMADMQAHHAQVFVQHKISEILKDKEDEKNT